MSRAVIVDPGVLEGKPIRAVSYLEPEHEWDSGYALFSGPPDSGATALVCLQCIIDEHPELAHEHGEAIRNGSIWTASMSVGPRRTG